MPMQFSIIIPTKNEEANIGRCLDSILQMDWDSSRYEIIVVDNGSDDRTVEIARQKGATVYIKYELTISGLRNFGALQAAGEILAFLDADCTVPQNWLHEASRYLPRKNVVCFGSPPVVPDDATWVQIAWFQLRKKRDLVLEVDWLESMNMFVRREIFEEVGGFDENLVTCEDYDLSFRLKNNGHLIADGHIVAVHHGEAASVRHFFQKEFWRGTSNLKGMKSHGLSWKELPSLVAPILYGVLSVLIITGMVINPMMTSNLSWWVFTAPLLLMQMPLLLMAFWKNRHSRCLMLVVQLNVLLNVYLLARCCAMLQRQ